MLLLVILKLLVNRVKFEILIGADAQIGERIGFGVSYDGWIVAEFVGEGPGATC